MFNHRDSTENIAIVTLIFPICVLSQTNTNKKKTFERSEQ